MPRIILQPAVWLKSFDDPNKAAKAWIKGRDFKIVGGPYCSIRDMNNLEKYGDIFIEYTPGKMFNAKLALSLIEKSELELPA